MDRILCFLLGLLCFSSLYAAPMTSSLEPVPAALSKLKYLTKKKPDLKADYYIFLKSASWCGPCRMVMPKIAKEYRKLRRGKVELVLIACEPPDKAKEYLEHYKAKFAGTAQIQSDTLPGVSFSSGGIPSMCLVDAQGNKLYDGHGSQVLEWKDLIKEDQAEKKKAAREAKKARSDPD